MSLRVLHVCEHIKGGTATSVGTLLSEQARAEEIEDVRAIVSTQQRQYLSVPDELLYTYDYPHRSVSGLRLLGRAIREASLDFQPNIIHLQGTFAGAVGRLRRWWNPKFSSDARIVYCSRGWSFLMDCGSVKKSAYSLIERTLSRYSDRIICISKDELDAARGIGIAPEKLRLVHNALPNESPRAEAVELPAEVAEARRQGRRVFLFAGRYDRQKGLDLLLNAFHGIANGDVLICAGGQFVGQESFTFGPKSFDVGWVTPGQLTYLLNQCDALVMPSRWEGFGLTAAEAMRVGRAVICSRCGGLPEVVEDGVTGIFFESLTPDCIRRTIEKPSATDLRSMGIAGRQRFLDNFTAPRLHKETLEVYQEARRS